MWVSSKSRLEDTPLWENTRDHIARYPTIPPNLFFNATRQQATLSSIATYKGSGRKQSVRMPHNAYINSPRDNRDYRKAAEEMMDIIQRDIALGIPSFRAFFVKLEDVIAAIEAEYRMMRKSHHDIVWECTNKGIHIDTTLGEYLSEQRRHQELYNSLSEL